MNVKRTSYWKSGEHWQRLPRETIRVSLLGDSQTLSEHGAWQLALGGPAWAGSVDQMTPEGPLQLYPFWFCDTAQCKKELPKRCEAQAVMRTAEMLIKMRQRKMWVRTAVIHTAWIIKGFVGRLQFGATVSREKQRFQHWKQTNPLDAKAPKAASQAEIFSKSSTPSLRASLNSPSEWRWPLLLLCTCICCAGRAGMRQARLAATWQCEGRYWLCIHSTPGLTAGTA